MTWYELTRNVGRDEPNNTSGRELRPGMVFSEYTRPLYGCCDTEHAFVLTSEDGSFFEVPRDAARKLTAEVIVPVYDLVDPCGNGPIGVRRHA